MKAHQSEVDVCVVGGGPAGSIFARRLAELGHRVCLIDRGRRHDEQRLESIGANVLPLLNSAGVQGRLDKSCALRIHEALVAWESPFDPRPAARSLWVLDRSRFDAWLRQSARATGAQVLEGLRAGPPELTRQGWRIQARTSAIEWDVRARFLADATGRTALGAGGRIPGGPHLIALFARWSGQAHRCRRMLLEARPNSWLWGAPGPDGSFATLCFTDPATIRTARRSKKAICGRLLAASRLFPFCVEGELAVDVIAADASPLSHSDPVSRSHIALGDSAVAVDPLASQGIQLAIQSGLHGAVVVHTLLTKPENANAAIDFYRSRTAVTAQRFSRAAAEYYSRHQEFSANAFWRARAAGAAPELSRVPRGKLESAGLDTPIRLAAAVTIADTPVIEGDLVHSRPAVSVPGIELPVAWLDGHEVAALVQSLAQTRTLGEVLRLWSRELPDREAWRILSWLWDHAMIEPEPMTARVR